MLFIPKRIQQNKIPRLQRYSTVRLTVSPYVDFDVNFCIYWRLFHIFYSLSVSKKTWLHYIPSILLLLPYHLMSSLSKQMRNISLTFTKTIINV
jgi:hypothetical protein